MHQSNTEVILYNFPSENRASQLYVHQILISFSLFLCCLLFFFLSHSYNGYSVLFDYLVLFMILFIYSNELLYFTIKLEKEWNDFFSEFHPYFAETTEKNVLDFSLSVFPLLRYINNVYLLMKRSF